MHNDSIVDERTLRELYLTGFEIAVREGKPKALMTSYNKVNGVYANENTYLLQDVLCKEWGFDGAVVTDWGGSNDFVEGVRAGMHLEMPSTGDDSAVQLLHAVQNGEIEESLIDERLSVLLELLLSSKAKTPGVPVDMEAQHEAACKLAEASIVLLKNEHDILPLKVAEKVAVIGDLAQNPRFQGAGSSNVNAARIDIPTAVHEQGFIHMEGYAQGYKRMDTWDESLALEAETLAGAADTVILYMGLTESLEVEGLDRGHMHLPENQTRLLKRIHSVNPHIVVVLLGGSAMEMPWLNTCEALVYASLPGQAGAWAIHNILTGAVCPSGKLSETYPVSYGDVPSGQYYPGKERTSEYREGLFVGYRAFASMHTPVQFPFGFGLSYTSFAYDELTIDSEKIGFKITNTGACAGAEVAQLYVSLPGAQVFRPALELKGFTKVWLQPGQSKQVSIPLDTYTFRYFNVETNRFEIEEGEYSLQIGASSQDIRLSGTLRVTGTGAPNPYAGKPLDCYMEPRPDQVTDDAFRELLGHEIPNPSWDTKALLGYNDTISQMFYARNPLARMISRLLAGMVRRSIAKGKPDLNVLFIYSMPFRGMGKMMNGMVSMKMVDDILLMVNGHAFRGLGRLVRDFFRRPKLAQQPAKNAAK